MKPLEAACIALQGNHRITLGANLEEIAKAAVLAFLRAAMGDEALCVGAGAYRPGNNSSLTRGKLAIQALIDYVEQP